ncbi:protein FAM151B [Chironomus tepperi]|uniref:protein FAM151B n=1 Tax=Chironomus tepperi TaxID=113505 RepID=UPI00391EF101
MACKLFRKYLIIYNILILIMLQMAYGQSVKNLTEITWSHATNSQKLLNEVLSSDINFIEADIVYGYLINDESKLRQPIMAHPPAEESDITLESFLHQIWDFNMNSTREKQKGIKLDFKSTDVFTNSISILNKMWDPNYEIWLNADIYSGPLNNTSTLPVDPDVFLTESNKFPNVTLSTGWTTRWGANFTEGIYTEKQVSDMIDGIRKNQKNKAITFPVRAGIAAQSIDTLTHLYQSLNATNLVTFTIWSSENDNVNVENLRKMIFHFGLDKVYVDVPSKLSSQLRLDVAPGNGMNKLRSNVLLGMLMIALGYILSRAM